MNATILIFGFFTYYGAATHSQEFNTPHECSVAAAAFVKAVEATKRGGSVFATCVPK